MIECQLCGVLSVGHNSNLCAQCRWEARVLTGVLVLACLFLAAVFAVNVFGAK